MKITQVPPPPQNLFACFCPSSFRLSPEQVCMYLHANATFAKMDLYSILFCFFQNTLVYVFLNIQPY